MIDLGLLAAEIPAAVWKYPKSFTLFNIILIVLITGNSVKVRLFLVALHLSFTILNSLLDFGTFLLALVSLTIEY